MFEWMKRKTPFLGSVLYRGSSLMRPEEFDFLQDKGIRLSEAKALSSCHWTLMMEHPEWGKAQLSCPKSEEQVPLDYLFDVTGTLTPSEKETAQAYGTQVTIRTEGKEENLLRDRKNALRFLHAVMGDDGLAVVDYLSMGVWSKAALDDELSHNADLDIEHIYAIHAVTDDDGGDVLWMHTHGLSEIGFIDFDIVAPHEDLFYNVSDIFRRTAFAIVEKEVGISTGRFDVFSPGGTVSFVDAATFNSQSDPKYSSMREDSDDEAHTRDRGVLCEPTPRGLVKLFKKKTVSPAKAFMEPIDDNILLPFSKAASNLMAQRARHTYSRLKQLSQEFESMEFPVLVKLGYATDGGSEEDKEHLWFSVNKFLEDEVDATLENEPYDIERMKIGNREKHPVSLISDWIMMTPAGSINPRGSRLVRAFRENPQLLAEMRDAMKEAENN